MIIWRNIDNNVSLYFIFDAFQYIGTGYISDTFNKYTHIAGGQFNEKI